MNDMFEERLSAAPRALQGLLVPGSWGFAALHPRLYAFTRSAGFERVQTRFFLRSLELDDQIGLDGKDGYPWVYCSFDEDQVETAEALEMGQMVTFQCVGSDNCSSGPTLKHCVLISAR